MPPKGQAKMVDSTPESPPDRKKKEGGFKLTSGSIYLLNST